MRDVCRAESEGFRIFGGTTEFGATGRRPPTTAIGSSILSGSTIRAYQSFADEGPRLGDFDFDLAAPAHSHVGLRQFGQAGKALLRFNRAQKLLLSECALKVFSCPKLTEAKK